MPNSRLQVSTDFMTTLNEAKGRDNPHVSHGLGSTHAQRHARTRTARHQSGHPHTRTPAHPHPPTHTSHARTHAHTHADAHTRSASGTFWSVVGMVQSLAQLAIPCKLSADMATSRPRIPHARAFSTRQAVEYVLPDFAEVKEGFAKPLEAPVRQLRHYFGSFLTRFSALYHPALAVQIAHACWMLFCCLNSDVMTNSRLRWARSARWKRQSNRLSSEMSASPSRSCYSPRPTSVSRKPACRSPCRCAPFLSFLFFIFRLCLALVRLSFAEILATWHPTLAEPRGGRPHLHFPCLPPPTLPLLLPRGPTISVPLPTWCAEGMHRRTRRCQQAAGVLEHHGAGGQCLHAGLQGSAVQ